MAIDGGKILAYLELDTSGYTAAMTSAQRELAAVAAQGQQLDTQLNSLTGTAGGLGNALRAGLTMPAETAQRRVKEAAAAGADNEKLQESSWFHKQYVLQ